MLRAVRRGYPRDAPGALARARRGGCQRHSRKVSSAVMRHDPPGPVYSSNVYAYGGRRVKSSTSSHGALRFVPGPVVLRHVEPRPAVSLRAGGATCHPPGRRRPCTLWSISCDSFCLTVALAKPPQTGRRKAAGEPPCLTFEAALSDTYLRDLSDQQVLPSSRVHGASQFSFRAVVVLTVRMHSCK